MIKIEKALLDCGVSARSRAWGYLHDMLEQSVKERVRYGKMVKLYKDVAEKNNVQWRSVARSVERAVNATFKNADLSRIPEPYREMFARHGEDITALEFIIEMSMILGDDQE